MQEASDLAGDIALAVAILWKPFSAGLVMLLIGIAIRLPAENTSKRAQPDDGHYYNVMPRWLNN